MDIQYEFWGIFPSHSSCLFFTHVFLYIFFFSYMHTSAGTFSPRLGFLTSVMETAEIGVAILAQPSNRVAPPLEGSRRGLVRRIASTRSLRISYADSRRKRLKLLPKKNKRERDRRTDERSIGRSGRSIGIVGRVVGRSVCRLVYSSRFESVGWVGSVGISRSVGIQYQVRFCCRFCACSRIPSGIVKKKVPGGRLA